MTEEFAYRKQLLKMEYEEKRKLEVLQWFTRNKQAPYILMIAGGMTFAYLGKVMAGEATTPDEDKNFFEQIGEAFKNAAPLTGVAGMLTYLTGTQDSNAAIEWSGAGLAAVGVTCLLLDAAGGAKGITGVLAGV